MDKMANLFNLLLLSFITYGSMQHLCDEREKSSIKIMAQILYIPMLCFGCFIIRGNELFMGIFQVLIMFLAIHFIFDITIWKEILFLVLLQFVVFAAATVVSGTIILFGNDYVINSLLLEGSVYSDCFTSILVYLLVFLGMRLLSRMLRSMTELVPIYLYIVLIFGGVINIVSLITNMRLVSQTGLQTREAYLSGLLPIGLFLFYVIFFVLFDRVRILQIQVEKEKMAVSYANKDVSYYKKLKEQQEEIKKLHHDMKNHLLLMQNMSQNHDKEQYASDLLQKIEDTQCYFDTDNGIADIIFYEKQNEALKANNRIEVAIEPGIIKDYPAVQICTILTNILDNAIEACSDGGHVINMKGLCNSLGVILTCENDISNDMVELLKKREDGKRYTVKQDKSNHGFGIENVKRAVQELDGTVNISTVHNRFIITIMLPITPVRTR